MNRLMRKPTMWFSNRSDTNLSVMTDDGKRLKILDLEKKGWGWNCTIHVAKTKVPISFAIYCEADLRLWFRICRLLAF